MIKWASSVKNLPSWFDHEAVTFLTMDKIRELSFSHNIMLLSLDKNPNLVKFYELESVDAILVVDDKKFNQR